MTFFTGCNPADRKFKRHGRSPNKVVGGAKGHTIWLVHNLNFCLYWCPIMKVFSLDNPVVLILACPYVCTCVHACVCVWAAQLVGDREGRNVDGWFTAEPLRTVWTRDTWQLRLLQHGQNPAEPISVIHNACESHSLSDVMTHALFTRGAVVELLVSERAWKYPHSVNKGSLGRRGEGVYMCVWTCDTVIYNSWTMYLDSLSVLHFWTREASILDGWGSDIQTLLLAAYGKSPSLPGSLPRTACRPPTHHPRPQSPSPPACRAGLSSNYTWWDLVKGTAS